jgi:hypothetical protein
MIRYLRLSLIVIFLVVIAVVTRLSDHTPNVSPLTAVALTAGYFLPLPIALATPILASVLADITLGFAGLLTTASIYLSYVLAVLLGRYLRPILKPLSGLGLALLAAVIFYLLTNFAVWLESGLYPRTAEGLLQSYYFALPFFRMSLLGDVAWSSVFFLAVAYAPVAARKRIQLDQLSTAGHWLVCGIKRIINS